MIYAAALNFLLAGQFNLRISGSQQALGIPVGHINLGIAF